jgi:multiple antibiotic resistance protein
MISDSFGFFIYTFTTIFVVVNPISGVVIFIPLTSKMTHEEKNEMAKKAVTLACLIALFFAISDSVPKSSDERKIKNHWIL